jgi:hypothetical protein
VKVCYSTIQIKCITSNLLSTALIHLSVPVYELLLRFYTRKSTLIGARPETDFKLQAHVPALQASHMNNNRGILALLLVQSRQMNRSSSLSSNRSSSPLVSPFRVNEAAGTAVNDLPDWLEPLSESDAVKLEVGLDPVRQEELCHVIV